MTAATDRTKALAAFLTRLLAKFPPPPPIEPPPPAAPAAPTPTAASAPTEHAAAPSDAGDAAADAESFDDPIIDVDLIASAPRPPAAANGATVNGAHVCSCHNDGVLREFLRSFLVWESTTPRAEAAMKRIEAGVVDINELRVCMSDEIASLIGGTYPRGEERAAFLRAALNEIYRREHCLRLGHLVERPRKESVAYLESLPGTPPFVADRVAALCLGASAMPLDERTHACLRQSRQIPADADLQAAGVMLTKAAKQVENADARGLYLALQAWADESSVVVVKTAKAEPRAGAKERRAKVAAKTARSSARKPASRAAQPKRRKGDK